MSEVKLIWLALAVPGLVQASEAPALGRLFNSPEERQMLERERTAAELQDQGGSTTLDGMLIRSKGGTTLWLNQEMQTPVSGKPSSRVGESLNGKQRRDLVEPGAIRVIPAAR